MKKLVLWIILLIFSLIIASQEYYAIEDASEDGVTILNHDNFHTEIHVSVPWYTTESQDEFSVIKFQDCFFYNEEIGHPAVPYIKKIIAIPDKGDISIEINNKKTILLENTYKIYPAQEPLPEIENYQPIFRYDENFYNTATEYNSDVVRIENVGIVRSYRFVELYIFPLQYNPSTGEVEIIYDMDITITYSGEGQDEINQIVPVTDRWIPIYQELFENWDFVSNSKPVVNNSYLNSVEINSKTYASEGDYLILVVSDELTKEIGRLAAWKLKLGYVPVIKQIPSSSSPEEIRNIIITCYNTWTIKPEFVLLVGEGEESEVDNHLEAHAFDAYAIDPGYDKGVESGIVRNDHYYSLVSGSDRYSDIAVSRISVRNRDELSICVTKIITYESYSFPFDNT